MADEVTTSNAVEENDNGTATTSIVVGEHSVYKDYDSLKEGKARADEFINTLKEENKVLRKAIEELMNKANVTEELKKIRETKMDTENTNTPLPEDAIKQIALKAMQETTEAQKAETNLTMCKQALTNISADVDTALKNKANELGVSVEYLEDIAKTSPKAFKSMFGIKDSVTFDSVNFLQSSRQNSYTNESNEAEVFFKNKENLRNPKAVSEFINKALKNPSILSNYSHW